MEETPASQKMAKIDLIKSLEKISSQVSRNLFFQDYLLNQFLPFSEKQEFLPFLGNLIIDH